MARKEVVQLFDDLDGSKIDGPHQTVAFAYRGAEYEIDLTEDNARKLTEALSPFIAAARKVGGRRTGGSAPAPIDRSQLAGMRTWARDHGYQVSDRGRISQEVQDAYHSAN